MHARAISIMTPECLQCTKACYFQIPRLLDSKADVNYITLHRTWSDIPAVMPRDDCVLLWQVSK